MDRIYDGLKKYDKDGYFVVYEGWHTMPIRKWKFFVMEDGRVLMKKKVTCYKLEDAWRLFNKCKGEFNHQWPWVHIGSFKKEFGREPTEDEKGKVFTGRENEYLKRIHHTTYNSAVADMMRNAYRKESSLKETYKKAGGDNGYFIAIAIAMVCFLFALMV